MGTFISLIGIGKSLKHNAIEAKNQLRKLFSVIEKTLNSTKIRNIFNNVKENFPLVL
ncbi:hypothetical protein [Blattabacterium cuenoti]|uniref:hypothetical protein n=1 Tax=Blattabacterium cuenoti TaxID=1653831 RepID=UPI00163BD9EF|nr:hypothetical protein [Blattabacterium cuenoti]